MSEPDPLSEALRSVRLSGAIFLDAELSAPWGFASPPASAGAHLLAPSAEHLILFHLLVEGKASARITGQASVELEAGDIAVLPLGDAHELWNGRVTELIDSSALLPKILQGAVVAERGGGGGRITKFICGYIGCDRQAKRLFLAGLPPLFKVNIRRDASGEWIESAIRHLASGREPTRAGGKALLATLAEALFIETLRRYMAELPRQRTGWLAAARDSAVGRALGAIHREPARAWTVASLAQRAGVSRTVFAERFARLLGEAPLSYVRRCRTQLGARLLETTDDTVLQVALNAGYESEAAFNRAFKREFELPPARYRSQLRTPTRAPSR
jgi:AraC-like DNA-binding protein